MAFILYILGLHMMVKVSYYVDDTVPYWFHIVTGTLWPVLVLWAIIEQLIETIREN